MAMNKRKHYAPSDGRSAEDRALERFAEMLIKKIEKINSDWKKPWFTENTLSWPKNLSGRGYNGMNAFMLFLYCEDKEYKIPVFLTFEQVKGLNYQGNIKEGKRLVDKEGKELPEVSVLKGSKSFPVFLTTFTVIHTVTNQKIKFDDYKKLSKAEQEEYKVYPNLQVYNVFNVDQTNIQESRPELYAKLKEDNIALPPELSSDGYCFPAIDEMIKNNEWLCPIYLKHQNEAYYSILKDEIVLPEKSQFYNPESFYGTGLHEMIHSTGAKGRLDRFDDYAKEELVAEFGSALIMQKFGLSKTIKEESCTYLKFWLKQLKESPAFIKNILLDVKRAAAMVNEKIEAVNLRLSETILEKRVVERLSVTGIPNGAVSEFHMLDNESRDAVYKALCENLYDKDTGQLVKDIFKPADRVVRVGGKYLDEALECVYDNLDSETLSKLVDCGDYFEGYLLENYKSALHEQFTREFEKKRNDSNWLKEQGIEGDVKWNLNFISTDGYYLVKATSENQSRLGALDHHCAIFRPFVDIGETFAIEDDLGYMTELRRRLLSKDEMVDPLGRITFAAPPVQYAETGNLRRDIIIDGEANAVFVIEPNSDIYDLNFVLELKKNELVKLNYESGLGNIIHDKDNGIYYTMACNLYDLFREKDQYYPVRVINDRVNMPLNEYLNLSIPKETDTLIPIQDKVLDRIEVDAVKEKIEVDSGLYAFRNNESLWGLHDGDGRIIVPPRWESFEKQEEKKGVAFRSFVYTDGEILPNSLIYQRNELADMADTFSRLSNVRIEERGEHNERWIAADIDGTPIVSEKITDFDWTQYQGGISSLLGLAMIRFSAYLDHPQEERIQNGIRV